MGDTSLKDLASTDRRTVVQGRNRGLDQWELTILRLTVLRHNLGQLGKRLLTLMTNPDFKTGTKQVEAVAEGVPTLHFGLWSQQSMDKNRTPSAKWHDNATKPISSSRICRCNAGLLPG